MVRAAAPRDLGPMPETPPSSPDPHDAPTSRASTPDDPTTEAPRAEPEPETAATPPAPRRLLRTRDDRVLGGVCSGLARYFNVDPLIIRIAAVALIFVGGFAVIAYLAALLLVPEDDGTGKPVAGKPGRFSTIAGAFVIVLAGVALLDGHWGVGFGWVFGALAPTVLIVTVLAIAGQRLLANRGENQPAAARIAGAALLLSAVVAGALIASAGAAVATAAGGGAVIAGVVIVLGVLMVVFSFRDRRARWLALPALVLAIPSGVVAAAGVDVDHGVGNRDYAPATFDDIRPGGYELGVGELVVDLRDTRWPRNEPVSLKVDVGTGHALVLVPADVCLQAKSRAGLGYVNLLGSETGGADIDEQRGTLARSSSARKLILDAHVGIGAIEVRHTRAGNGHWDQDRHGPDEISGTLAAAGCAGERA
jgi:phage shock protein PspC (stress-responsive transcriptional regulator)/predicted membrane protein